MSCRGVCLLSPGVTVSVRLCAVPARVFKFKKQQMLDELFKDGIFGECPARVWTIEYQKRGLPHLHLLVFLKDSDHFLEPEVIDEMVCAELPDPSEELREIVTSQMIHGPCGLCASLSVVGVCDLCDLCCVSWSSFSTPIVCALHFSSPLVLW